MKLRVAHVIVQPVLVWDDGDELTPGPPLEPQAQPLSKLAAALGALPGQVQDLEDQILAAQAAENVPPDA